ncbi:hypothetical protein RDWZM_001141 [Blomia tropicalis]|uniref:Ubiquitin-like domain-containing protein n=1 Tax=Blomia tropicalis TaxID=40697 RepID=A0A9Q0RR30_BLOTA|nr:hypothetical protein RDWZM_001141 [Blomia tropicalis]
MDESKKSNSSNDEVSVTDLIEITIKTIDSKNFQFQVENDIPLRTFKEQIAEQVGIEPENQRMIFCGRVLSDDKSLKDYNIDNGKVIHLVKKTPPLPRNNSNSSGNNTSTTNSSNDQSRNRRIHSYRSDDGHIVMGTIQLEPQSQILNQMVRQLFSAGRSEANAGASSSSNGNTTEDPVRDRLTQVRRFLSYINTNFQILEHPDVFPRTYGRPDEQFDQTVTYDDYQNLFNQFFSSFERMRTRMSTYLNQLRDHSSSMTEQQRMDFQNNHSILMRISHHLSHTLHLLTDFNIDYSNPNLPLTLNVSEPVPNSSTSTSTTQNSQPQVSVEISAATTTSSSMPRFSSQYMQSPMVIMEVDANVSNLPRNILSGLRGFNFSFPDDVMPNPQGNSTGQSSENQSTAEPAAASSNQTSGTENNNAPSTTGPCTTTSTTTTQSNSSTTNTNPTTSGSGNNETHVTITTSQDFGRFDPFLNCNSPYTIPEVRSAANLNRVDLMQIVNQLSDVSNFDDALSSIPDEEHPLSIPLYNLFQNSRNSESASSQVAEFFNLIQFIIRQLNNQSNEMNSVEFATTPTSTRISDYLLNLNFFRNSEEPSFVSDMLYTFFKNLNFEDALNIINSEFDGFQRFQEPFRNLIRIYFLKLNESIALDNIRAGVTNHTRNNHNLFDSLFIESPSNPGISLIRSFENFINGAFSDFLFKIMQSSSGENFENDFMAALRTLISNFIQFCRVCFPNGHFAISNILTNYFARHVLLNETIASFLTSMITELVLSYSSTLVDDQEIVDQVQQYIVYSNGNKNGMQMETSDIDGQSTSNDSEVEFADAVSDFPSTSSSQKAELPKTEEEMSQGNWQNIVPNEWVPIINEDIKKQKNIDKSHQPPFSDAYLNGMSKKRRLEHKPDDDESCD